MSFTFLTQRHRVTFSAVTQYLAVTKLSIKGMGNRSSITPGSGDEVIDLQPLTVKHAQRREQLMLRCRRHKSKTLKVHEIIDKIDYRAYEYPFENLVFEGGGAKGQVYVGALQVSYFPSVFQRCVCLSI